MLVLLQLVYLYDCFKKCGNFFKVIGLGVTYITKEKRNSSVSEVHIEVWLKCWFCSF